MVIDGKAGKNQAIQDLKDLVSVHLQIYKCLLQGCSKKHYLEELEAGIQRTKIYMYGRKHSKGLSYCEREERDKITEFEK